MNFVKCWPLLTLLFGEFAVTGCGSDSDAGGGATLATGGAALGSTGGAGGTLATGGAASGIGGGSTLATGGAALGSTGGAGGTPATGGAASATGGASATLATGGTAVGTGGTSQTGSDDVAGALKALNVNTTVPVRNDQAGNPVDPEAPPLGAQVTTGVVNELVSIGSNVALKGGTYSGSVAILDDQLSSAWSEGATLLLPTTTDTSWADLAAGTGDTTPRAAVACDTDNDGFDETLMVYVSSGTLYVRAYDDKQAGFAGSGPVSLGATSATDVDIACGDFKGNGASQLVVAEGGRENGGKGLAASVGKVRVLDPSKNYTQLWSWAPSSAVNVRSLRVAAGNLDNKLGDELVVGSSEDSVGYFRIFSAQSSGGTLSFTSVPFDNHVVQHKVSGTTYNAGNAAVAIGDVDGSGLPSVILAGVDAAVMGTPVYVAERIQYDVTKATYSVVKSAHFTNERKGTCGGSSPGVDDFSFMWWGCGGWIKSNVYEAIVKTPKLDGTNRYILVNESVFDKDFTEKSSWALPSQDGKAGCFFRDQIWWNGSCNNNWDSTWNRGHIAIAVGNFDNNADRADRIVTADSTVNGILLWGLNATKTSMELKGTYATKTDVTSNGPVLVATNVDDDSLSLVYDHHEYTVTEPIPLAVMSAPPCRTGVGQNTDDCQTFYGRDAESSLGTDFSFETSASVRLGGEFGANKIPVVGALFGDNVKMELSGFVKSSTSLTWGSENSTLKGIGYSSGAMEDTVVFQAIPYDVYYYKVASSPTPLAGQSSAVGKLLPVAVPRTPQVNQAELGFYNQVIGRIAADRMIGKETLSHTVGDITTYPTVLVRDALLTQYGGVNNWVGPVSVGESASGGSTEVNLEISKTSSFNFQTCISGGATLKTTFGTVFVEVEGEAGGGFGITTSSTDTSKFEGTVGTLPAATFAANQYKFGLFTYVKNDHPSGKLFPVIQYWVE